MEYDPAESAAVMSSILGSAHGWEMMVRLGQSLELTDALWDLVPVVLAAGEGHDKLQPADAADQSAAGRRLDPGERARARNAANRFAAVLDAAYLPQVADQSVISAIDEAAFLADPFSVLGSLIDPSALLAAAQPDSSQVADLSADQVFYMRSYLQFAMKSPRTPMLLRALLVTAVGTLEPLMTRLVRLLLFHQTPGEFRSLADPSLDDQARRLCFGSPTTWREVLTGRFGITALDSLIDWTSLGKLWEDRNILVHRAGIVDSRHSTRTGSVPNMVLELEAVDVQSAIDEIGPARFGLVGGVWDHMTPGTGAIVGDAAGSAAIESLRAGRWRQAAGLARVEEAFAADTEALFAAKVNHWLARDAGLGADAIRREVEEWDATGLPRKFELARHVLLRQDGQAIDLLHQLIAEGAVTASDVRDWPLFDRLKSEGKLDR